MPISAVSLNSPLPEIDGGTNSTSFPPEEGRKAFPDCDDGGMTENPSENQSPSRGLYRGPESTSSNYFLSATSAQLQLLENSH